MSIVKSRCWDRSLWDRAFCGVILMCLRDDHSQSSREMPNPVASQVGSHSTGKREEAPLRIISWDHAEACPWMSQCCDLSWYIPCASYKPQDSQRQARSILVHATSLGKVKVPAHLTRYHHLRLSFKSGQVGLRWAPAVHEASVNFM